MAPVAKSLTILHAAVPFDGSVEDYLSAVNGSKSFIIKKFLQGDSWELSPDK
jgi:hypothetical protein